MFSKICLAFAAVAAVLLQSGNSEASPSSINDVVFVILTQADEYHLKRIAEFDKEFKDQLSNFTEMAQPVYYHSHVEWPHGDWTIFPIIEDVSSRHQDKKWLFICEEETRIDLTKLMRMLGEYDSSKELFLGHALKDSSPTIIHHFDMVNENPLLYPDFAAGFAFSISLVKSLIESDRQTPRDFSIDAKHELAKFVWNDGQGVKLTDVSFLCVGHESEACATTYPNSFPDCGPPIGEDDLFFAVKTCKQNHGDRVPVVKGTWGKFAKHIEYYSQEEDPSIPTIDLGVPNTERGHCGKTMAIIDRAYHKAHIRQRSWLVITDDDTILSVNRMRQLLACYNPKNPVALGERYGYGLAKEFGYDYITMGGGIALSRGLVDYMVKSELCKCAHISSPDDMTLGTCFKRLTIPCTHSPLFHQARPMDYSDGYLSHQKPVSFHKHWNCDPYAVYRDWFEKADKPIKDEL